MVGGAFHTAVVMSSVESEAAKPTSRSLKGKALAQALQDMPPLTFPEHERLHDATKWTEESWCVCSIVRRYPSNVRSCLGDIGTTLLYQQKQMYNNGSLYCYFSNSSHRVCPHVIN